MAIFGGVVWLEKRRDGSCLTLWEEKEEALVFGRGEMAVWFGSWLGLT